MCEKRGRFSVCLSVAASRFHISWDVLLRYRAVDSSRTAFLFTFKVTVRERARGPAVGAISLHC